MSTVAWEAWELLSNLVEAVRTGPFAGPAQFLAVPLAAGGGLLARPGAGRIHIRDCALIDALVAAGYLRRAFTPHGLTLLSVTPAGFAADRRHGGPPRFPPAG